jgi:hypothetical protein
MVTGTIRQPLTAGGFPFLPAWWCQFPADDAFLPVTLSLPCQLRVYPIGTARSPLLHDILGQAAGLRQMVLVPGRDDTAFAHLLVRAML